jgi:hypothetical protein
MMELTRLQKFLIGVKLAGVFIRWCFKYPGDITTLFRENYQDIKFRYEMETDPEMRAWSEEIENQFSNGSDT